jgi:hypothetical protein
MRVPWRLLVCVLVVASWLPGCREDGGSPDGDSGGSDTVADGSDGGASDSGGDDGSSDGGGDDGSSDGGGDDGSSDGGGDDGSSDSGGDDGSSDGDDGGACPEDPADDECRVCVKANCCTHWATCQADDICQCTLDCVLEGNSPGSCKNPCGGENDLYRAVYFCGQAYCLGLCDWDCC